MATVRDVKKEIKYQDFKLVIEEILAALPQYNTAETFPDLQQYMYAKFRRSNWIGIAITIVAIPFWLIPIVDALAIAVQVTCIFVVLRNILFNRKKMEMWYERFAKEKFGIKPTPDSPTSMGKGTKKSIRVFILICILLIVGIWYAWEDIKYIYKPDPKKIEAEQTLKERIRLRTEVTQGVDGIIDGKSTVTADQAYALIDKLFWKEKYNFYLPDYIFCNYLSTRDSNEAFTALIKKVSPVIAKDTNRLQATYWMGRLNVNLAMAQAIDVGRPAKDTFLKGIKLIKQAADGGYKPAQIHFGMMIIDLKSPMNNEEFLKALGFADRIKNDRHGSRLGNHGVELFGNYKSSNSVMALYDSYRKSTKNFFGYRYDDGFKYLEKAKAYRYIDIYLSLNFPKIYHYATRYDDTYWQKKLSERERFIANIIIKYKKLAYP